VQQKYKKYKKIREGWSLSAPPYILEMYNFSCSVIDHDNSLPAVIKVQPPCHSSQCASTHSATVDVHSRHYLCPHTVVPSTSNVAPTTCAIPTDVLAPLLHLLGPCLMIHDTCTVDLANRTVDQDARPVGSRYSHHRSRYLHHGLLCRTVAPTTHYRPFGL
jgi:hypothetical protein